jgi:beta-fructofuranosidase
MHFQSDVEVSFAIDDLSKAEQFNPKWLTDPQALCKKRGAREKGEVGPFVFRTNSNGSRLVVLMCNDPTNSTFEAQVYRPTFASFVNVDIAKTKTIALRTLVRVLLRALIYICWQWQPCIERR